MSLKERIERELTSAAHALDRGTDVPPAVVETESGRLFIELVTIERLACAFDGMTYSTAALAESSLDGLQQIADQLSHKLSYLLEPVSAIELDSQSCTVQLRSSPPSKDREGTRYYELVVRRDGLALRRFSKSPRCVRQEIPAEVTREVLIRLAMDLAEAAEVE